jgi:hypothetical protein
VRGVTWRWATPKETEEFRARKRMDTGFFDALAPENKGIYTVIEGSVVGIDGPALIPPGTEIKVLSSDEMKRYMKSDWVYVVVSASVRYGDRVESLKPNTFIAIISEPSDT